MYLLKTLDGEYFFSNSTGNDSSVSIVDEISDEDYKYLSSTPDSYKIVDDKVVMLISIEEIKKDKIRQSREVECFPIINRGVLWYDKLTEEQKAELAAWYQQWLDAPQTSIIPKPLQWLTDTSL